MFDDTQVIQLFPTYVWVHDLPAAERDKLEAELRPVLDQILANRPAVNPGETWQTDPDLHHHRGFAGLLPFIDAAARSTLEFLQVDYQSFRITGCWANVNPAGSPHAAHTHPNNFLSGVYYLHAPSGGDSISFHDPRPQTNIITPRVRQKNQHNARQINVAAKSGRLVLFPAWFHHSVLPNQSQEERISIAFNIMFDAFAETMSVPKWRGLPTGADG